MSAFVKEEAGQIPGRRTVSAIADEKVVWQREVPVTALDAAYAAAGIALSKHEKMNSKSRPVALPRLLT